MSQESAGENSHDWRKPTYPDDLKSALNSIGSKDDFSGRAALYSSGTETTPLPIDLLVQSASFYVPEHFQEIRHLGDTYSTVFFGKALMEASVTCVLIDTHKNFGKKYLLKEYMERLRLTAVAASGKVPVLRIRDTELHGPLMSMRVSQTSSSLDTVTVIMSILVTCMRTFSGKESVTFNYVLGNESPGSSTPTSSSPDTPEADESKPSEEPAKDPEVKVDKVGPPEENKG